MPHARVTDGLREVAQDLSELLDELRDSLTHGPAGVRREADIVLRDLELLPGDLCDEANSIEDAAEETAENLMAELAVEADQAGAVATQLAASP